MPPAEDAVEKGDIDEEELEEIEDKLELDYQIGEDLREKASSVDDPYTLMLNICFPGYP